MKRTFAIASLVLISLTANCQKKDSTKVKPAPVAEQSTFNDSVKIASIRDFNNFNTILQEQLPYATYIKLTPEQVLTEMCKWLLKNSK